MGRGIDGLWLIKEIMEYKVGREAPFSSHQKGKHDLVNNIIIKDLICSLLVNGGICHPCFIHNHYQ